MVVPTAEIRQEFPALERREAGQPVAYFDGPGGTQVPRRTAAAVRDYLLDHNANAGWAFPTSAETDAVVERGRRALADFLGAEPREIVFGANMTTLTFHLSRALGRTMEPGDEIVVTELDHHANIAPWRALEEEVGATVRSVPFDPESGRLEWDALTGAIGDRTRLVAVGLASNALGTVNDVRRAADAADEAGALLFVDAVHAAPHLPLDVDALGCDFLACSAYKFYGPHVGVLYGRERHLGELDVPPFEPAPDAVPDRVETGTANFEGIAGAAAAVEFLASLAGGEGGDRRRRLRTVLEELEDRGRDLFRVLWEGLRAIDGVRRYGPPPGEARTPTVSFSVEGVSPRDVAARLAERGVFVSHGDFYAPGVLRRLGVGGAGLVRAGCACYTSSREVRRLVDGVASIAES